MLAGVTAVGILNSWVLYFFNSVMNFWHTYLGLRWELVITSQKKFGTGLNFSWNFPRLFKYPGVLVPLGAVAGCNFFVCACPCAIGDWDFPALFVLLTIPAADELASPFGGIL